MAESGKRPYTKRNKEYWNKVEGKSQSQNIQQLPDFQPAWVGGDHWSESSASHNSRIAGSRNYTGASDISGRFPNLDAGVLPYEYNSGAVSLCSSIEMCMKAWTSVQVFRNHIEGMVEFSNAPYKLTCKNKSALLFFKRWLKKINFHNFAEQFYRERYRSGNIGTYRIDGKLDSKALKSLDEVLGSNLKNGEIPLKYIILNPSRIAVEGISNAYFQILKQADVKKFNFSQDTWDRLIKDRLGELANNQLSNSSILIPLDPAKFKLLSFQKQDYEPLSIPPFWGVLDDFELKMELRKIDKTIIRTVENTILQVTQGDEKYGSDPKKLEALQNMFQNPSIQRVLVSDYTTEIKFIIPEIKRVLGKEKYEVVNQDIRDGLQSVLLGDEKFSNLSTKLKVFLTRLERGQDDLKAFIEGEMQKIANNMGFRDAPTIEIEKINLKDEVQLQRVYTRLLELGVLTDDEVIEAINTGMLPTPEENLQSQKKFKELKDKGLYLPKQNRPDEGSSPGRPNGTTGPQDNPGDQQNQRTGSVSIADCDRILIEVNDLSSAVEKQFKKIKEKKRLKQSEKDFCYDIAKVIAQSKERENWNDGISEFFQKGGAVSEDGEIASAIIEIAAEHDIDNFEAAVIYHSRK